jgi:acetyl-CoA C-acetyltransferase
MTPIKIKTHFMTRFGRRSSDFIQITMDAVRGALAGVDRDRIRHVYIASYAPAALCQIEDPFGDISRAIGTELGDLGADYHGLFRTGADALYAAITNQNTAHGEDILVVGSEKMTHIDPGSVAGLLSARENQHDRAYGATLPALGALVTRVYMNDHNIPDDALHFVAVKNHRHGSLNPKAHFRKAITVDDVAHSPLIADPLRRLHCAPVSDGAAALVLGRGAGDVAIVGWGRGVDRALLQERADLARFETAARASAAALDHAGVDGGDIDVVEIHDAFASFELINLEELGFCKRGAAWKRLADGDFEIGGTLSVNPSGGMKARGHPIGASGLSSCVELYDQLTGCAGARQHEGAQLAMVQSVGGVSRESFVFILEST